jgi:hypothetical protein
LLKIENIETNHNLIGGAPGKNAGRRGWRAVTLYTPGGSPDDDEK